MEFTESVIMQYIADFILPFSRISALIMSMIGFGSKIIPGKVKLFLCVPKRPSSQLALSPKVPGFFFAFSCILQATGWCRCSRFFLKLKGQEGNRKAPQAGTNATSLRTKDKGGLWNSHHEQPSLNSLGHPQPFSWTSQILKAEGRHP